MEKVNEQKSNKKSLLVVKLLKKFWLETKKLFKKLNTKENIITFIIVYVVMGVPVWVPILLSIILHNKWLWSIGMGVFAFWQAPLTPYILICCGITFGITNIRHKIKERRKKRWLL